MGHVTDAEIFNLAVEKKQKRRKAAPKKAKTDTKQWGGPLTRAPEYLTGYAKYVFNNVIELLPPERLRRADKFTVVAYAEAVATHREAMESVHTYGFTLCDDRGVQKPNPANSALQQARSAIKALGDELGLSPKARDKGKIDAGGDNGVWDED